MNLIETYVLHDTMSVIGCDFINLLVDLGNNLKIMMIVNSDCATFSFTNE